MVEDFVRFFHGSAHTLTFGKVVYECRNSGPNSFQTYIGGMRGEREGQAKLDTNPPVPCNGVEGAQSKYHGSCFTGLQPWKYVFIFKYK